MHLTQQTSVAVSPVLSSGLQVNHKPDRDVRYHLFVAAQFAVKIRKMTEENNRKGSVHGAVVICDAQEEYSENLFRILMRKYSGKYQFHIFHDPEKLRCFLRVSAYRSFWFLRSSEKN